MLMPDNDRDSSRLKFGRLCLDFANTVQWHKSDQPQEMLHTYSELVGWAEEVGLLTKTEKENHLIKAEKHPTEANRVLQQAITLREAIYRIFAALATGEQPPQKDLVLLNTALTKVMSGAKIINTADHFIWTWEWEMDKEALDVMIPPIVRSAGALLTSDKRRRVGQCADDRGCGWLFLDTSKNHSRRWCNMGDCGNRAKQRRHYQRSQKA